MEDRLSVLESRLQRLEDEHAIGQLIASYGPLVDDGVAQHVAALWTGDGTYDIDTGTMESPEQIAAMVESPAHQGLIAGGCAHFLGPARVHVDGDSAVAVCYSLLIRHRDGAFSVFRATANHFALTRTSGGWKISRRTSRVLDGAEQAHLLLGAGVRGEAPPA
ncbi:nuclear transport factor 2 family protein [Gordonia sp. CPCC 205515]|uniref:nuclear transport factor 2 family protein n=1 Tax=Gordonia sp. CPCC 205515 TaxID=3140791 RepID=UPI003AF3C3DD